jgi:hypothetical protein
MSQQDVTVTPVRVYVQHGVDRGLRLGTEHVSRLKRVGFDVSDAPPAPLSYLVGDWVIRWVVVVWDGTDRCIDVSARKVLKDGSLGARSSDVRLYRSDKIPAWLAPVIEEHTPEWAR